MEKLSEYFVNKLPLWKVFMVLFAFITIMWIAFDYFLMIKQFNSFDFWKANIVLAVPLSLMFTLLFKLIRHSNELWDEITALKAKVNTTTTKEELIALSKEHIALRKKVFHEYHYAELYTIWEMMKIKYNTFNLEIPK